MDPTSMQEAKYKTQSILGIINDTIQVGIANIQSAPLDVAIIKATLQDEVVPKEKHVRTLVEACTASAPRQNVNYVIQGLLKRLEENSGWLVTLKTLIVFHRLMRETDASFLVEVLRHGDSTGHQNMLLLSSFTDATTKETTDYSSVVCVYSRYLDERLAVYRSVRFDPKQGDEQDSESALKSCSAAELLANLPAAQRLFGYLVSCVPVGAAQKNAVTLLACSLVLTEVRSVYKAVCDGVQNLMDHIFEMGQGDVLKGVELVRAHQALNEQLTAFEGAIGGIPSLQGTAAFPPVQPLHPDLVANLLEYVEGGCKPPALAEAAPSMADLLGFQSFVIGSKPSAQPLAAAAAAAVAAAPFDAFASFSGPAPPPALPSALPPPPAPAAVAAPPVPEAAGVPQLKPPASAPPLPPVAAVDCVFSSDAFGDGGAFGAAAVPPPAPALAVPPALTPPLDPTPAPLAANPAPGPSLSPPPPVPSPAAPVANPFSPTNPFTSAPAAPAGTGNPFGAVPAAATGYSLNPPDPLSDIARDLLGKPLTVAPPKPMRSPAATAGNSKGAGSPSTSSPAAPS